MIFLLLGGKGVGWGLGEGGGGGEGCCCCLANFTSVHDALISHWILMSRVTSGQSNSGHKQMHISKLFSYIYYIYNLLYDNLYFSCDSHTLCIIFFCSAVG